MLLLWQCVGLWRVQWAANEGAAKEGKAGNTHIGDVVAAAVRDNLLAVALGDDDGAVLDFRVC
jgi:hypothetical protein